MEIPYRPFTVSQLATPLPQEWFGPRLQRACGLLLLLFLSVVASRAQAPPESGDSSPQVFEGVINNNVYGVGQSIMIKGTVKEGAIAFGGDVIVQGTVEGDVAAIGGSVIQLAGSRIGGDVIVVGGNYRPTDKVPNRNPARKVNDMVYAGYEQELRETMRNPTGILAPSWSPTYIGLRLLSILFWFVAALGLTTAMPGAVSRGVARLQLTSLRVAAIGFVGALVIGGAVAGGLRLLPTPLAALIGLFAFMVLVVAWVFGRIVIAGSAGRWLQRRFLSRTANSESVAFLIGTALWAVLASLPFVWPFVFALTLVLGFGLTLTAGQRKGWKKATMA